MVLPTYPRMAPLHGGSSAGKSDLCCGRLLNVVGLPGLHQSGLMSTCFADCPSLGPRKNDLTIYWALGPFVRSFTLPVDPWDICPPHLPILFNRDPIFPQASSSPFFYTLCYVIILERDRVPYVGDLERLKNNSSLSSPSLSIVLIWVRDWKTSVCIWEFHLVALVNLCDWDCFVTLGDWHH
jgi:hypothetical protein